jgi:hypothetical protein
MSQLSALGSRQFQAAPNLNNDARQADAKSSTSGAPVFNGQNALDAVSLSKNALDLSTQGLSKRVDELGNATIDVAQNFMTSFAQSLFGDAAKGATLSFDEASISAQSGFAAIARHSEGPNGVSDGAAFSLNESSHFIGKGTITTADGQRFDFEIEVQYESRVEAAASRTTGSAAPDQSGQTPAADQDALPSKQLPDVDFGGSLGDLFKLLGRYLQSQVSAPADASANADAKSDTSTQADQGGTLSLRLLNLINHATLLDDKATPADQRAKALADAYGAPASGAATPSAASATDDSVTPTTPSADASAPAPAAAQENAPDRAA